MNSIVRPALVIFVFLSVLTGVAYPLLVTGIAQAAFDRQARGSLVERDGRLIGSMLIGQGFSDPGHFWGRPSATGPMSWNASGSGGSNLGPISPALTDAVKGRVEALRAADPGNMAPVPVDLVTASGSGLDPEISVAAARYQAPRIARLRKLPTDAVAGLIERHREERQFGFLGEPRVNVLRLNLALDALSPPAGRQPSNDAPVAPKPN